MTRRSIPRPTRPNYRSSQRVISAVAGCGRSGRGKTWVRACSPRDDPILASVVRWEFGKLAAAAISPNTQLALLPSSIRDTPGCSGRNMRRLIGVYDADGGVWGEVTYVWLHLLGRTECALCDITHSPIRQKAAWKELAHRLSLELGYEMVTRHRNETNEMERLACAGSEPCVLLEHSDGKMEIILDSAELTNLAGSVDRFEEALLTKLNR